MKPYRLAFWKYCYRMRNKFSLWFMRFEAIFRQENGRFHSGEDQLHLLTSSTVFLSYLSISLIIHAFGHFSRKLKGTIIRSFTIFLKKLVIFCKDSRNNRKIKILVRPPKYNISILFSNQYFYCFVYLSTHLYLLPRGVAYHLFLLKRYWLYYLSNKKYAIYI